jgi:hypothetical protein
MQDLLLSFGTRKSPYVWHLDLWKSIDYMDFQVQGYQALVFELFNHAMRTNKYIAAVYMSVLYSREHRNHLRLSRTTNSLDEPEFVACMQ